MRDFVLIDNEQSMFFEFPLYSSYSSTALQILVTLKTHIDNLLIYYKFSTKRRLRYCYLLTMILLQQ